MSILIKGMEMPKDGVYWCEIGVADDIAMITIHGEDRKTFPLVPVPPHGRLIEKNAVFKLIRSSPNVDRQLPVEFMKALYELPTIIPAEEGEQCLFTAMLRTASTIKTVCVKTSDLSEQKQSKSVRIGWEWRIAQILKIHKITIEHKCIQKTSGRFLRPLVYLLKNR